MGTHAVVQVVKNRRIQSPRAKRHSRRKGTRLDRQEEAQNVAEQLERTFTAEVVAQLRASAGYNPRQRVVTAYRLMLVAIEAFMQGGSGGVLSFATMRTIFIKRFGFVQSCPFQLRFKQAAAAKFFRAALEHLVSGVVTAAGLQLSGPLKHFSDVRLYDGTGQRVPPRGREALPACSPGRAGTKWLFGYSIKTGLLTHGAMGAETTAEIPVWRKLVPSLERNVLYLLDLGFFERQLFIDAIASGAHVLMRLKTSAKVRVVAHMNSNGTLDEHKERSLDYHLKSLGRSKGTSFDLDVLWGKGKQEVRLRLVGYAHKHNNIRWYLTTVGRDQLSAGHIIQAYRARWSIELLFRELKQNVDLGRSFTAHPDAVEALTYAAMLSHVAVRSLRVQAALANQIPLTQLRPLACLRVAKVYSKEIVDALQGIAPIPWAKFLIDLGDALLQTALEKKPSRSRNRIPLQLGAFGA